MSGWLLGLALVVGYLALQVFANLVRFKKIIKAMSEMSDILATVSGLPENQAEKVKKLWEDARTRAATSAAGGLVILLAILVFLVALAVHGRL